MSKREEKPKHTPRNSRVHDEEECQDKICHDTKSNIKVWMKNRRSYLKEPECPLDKNSLGRNTWSLLHTMAAFYPKKPTDQEKKNMAEFIRLMSILYPCSCCSKDFREDISQLPPQLDSRDSLAKWFCIMHNKVNNKLNKPEFDCSKIDERWRTGPKDGSCI